MFKNIILSFFALILLSVLIVLFIPFSLFQEKLIESVNSSGLVRLMTEKPIPYSLINADKLTVRDVTIEIPGYDIVLEELFIKVNLKSLVKKDIVVEELSVKIHSVIENDNVYVKDSSAKKTKESGIDSLSLKNVNITLGKLLISKYRIEDVSLSSQQLKVGLGQLLIGGDVNISLYNKSIQGDVSFKSKNNQEIDANLNFFDIEGLSAKIGVKDLNLHGDLNLMYKVEVKNFSKIFENKMNIIISGKELRWIGKDLDKILDAYIDSKKLGLLDVAGYLTLGPIGILVAKGTDLGNAGIRGIVNGETDINEVYAKIDVIHGIGDLLDVAIATKEHRIVMRGRIDLNSREFKDFGVGTVDEKGCSIFTQKITGNLSKPEIGALGSIMNETFSKFEHLFKTGISLIVDSCDDQYLGVVK